MARACAERRGVDEITVIGGATCNPPRASVTRMYWTTVHGSRG
jgi:hypothetical protein